MTVTFPALTLPRYAQRIGYRLCAFMGVNHPDNPHYACRELWTQEQRDNIEQALLLAQEQIESVIGYPLVPKWITDERHRIEKMIKTGQQYLIAGGTMLDTMISAGVAPNYALDPATVTVNAVTCAVDNIHIFYPGTDKEIFPDTKVITAGVLTAEIPWCSLVDESYWWPPNVVDYADALTWGLASVDVRCISNDDTIQAVLHKREDCAACDEVLEDACIYLRNPTLGLVNLVGDACACGYYTGVSLNYYAGKTELSRTAEDAIIRLAHANLPTEPCGCAITQRMWERDRQLPKYFLSRERINCPFGMSEGAWTAWVFANGQGIVRGSLFA